MKKLIPIFGLLLISNFCISQVSIGIDYVLNNDSGRKYSNSLSGLDINLKYHLTDRINISPSLIFYKNYKTSQVTYKNWSADLNGEIIIYKRKILNLYGILGVGFQQESVNPRGVIIDPYNAPELKKQVFLLNVGLGSKCKITKNIWINLYIATNSSYEIIISPGLLYQFDFKKK